MRTKNENFKYLNCLDKANKCIIEQIIDKHVFKEGCDNPIRYLVKVKEENKKYIHVFTAEERSGWCHKNCVQYLIYK